LTEAAIVAILVREGDVIREDAPLLEVETDKAQVEIPSPMGGRVEKIHVQPGQTVKVGAPLVTFADGAAKPAAAAPPPPAARAKSPVAATPATRRLARELGVALETVRGSGPGGRVLDEDVRAATPGSRGAPAPAPVAPAGPARPLTTVGLEAPPLPRFEQWGPVERAPLSHLRRTIAERMTFSATLIPHVTHFDRADITDLDAIITRNLEAARVKGVTLTLTSFLLKAAALALLRHPTFNASLDPAAGEMVLKRYYHLGVAVATERGLIVPVLREIDRKPVLEIARELSALAQRVRDGKATLDGTFTITNMGALGGTNAIPIINYPEVAILGVSRARQEAVVRQGQIVPRLMLPLTLTFDHRVADGADGARFATEIVQLLEAPERLLGEW